MESDKIRPSSWVRRKTNWTTWRTIAVTKSVLANSHFSIFLVFYKCINWKLTKASQGIKKSWMIRKKRGKVNFEVFLLNSIDMGLEDPTWHEQIIHPINFKEYLLRGFALLHLLWSKENLHSLPLQRDGSDIITGPVREPHVYQPTVPDRWL